MKDFWEKAELFISYIEMYVVAIKLYVIFAHYSLPWRPSSNRALTTTGLQADEIDEISDVSNTVRLSDVK